MKIIPILIIIELVLSSCINQEPEVNYPRIFRAWSGIESLPKEDDILNYSRHDLCFGSLSSILKLEWQLDEKIKYRGLSTEIIPGNLAEARKRKEQLLRLNPDIKIIGVIGYRDGFYGTSKNSRPAEFPSDSPFWLKDKNNNPVVGWAEDTNVDGIIDRNDDTPWVLVDFTREDLQDILASKVLAIKKTGLVDGIFLDWWKEAYSSSDDIMEPGWNPVLSREAEVTARINILKKIRAKVGEDFLILVNSNYDTIPKSAPYVNGIFMECYKDYDKGYSKEQITKMENTLSWAEENLKEPRINCLEGWRKVYKYDNVPETRIQERNSEENMQCMRMITSLSLTHSDGYVLFGDPNQLPCNDHLHNWYDHWDARLGKPVSAKSVLYMNINGLFIREFDNGYSVYNNSGAAQAVTFPGGVTGVSSKISGARHMLPDSDGEIYLKEGSNMGMMKR